MKMCKLEDYEKLSMDSSHRTLVRNELMGEWHPDYLPDDSSLPQIKDSTVVEMGAGCGETAFFYLKHEASRIISIESDSEAISHYLKNFPDVVFIPRTVKMVLVEAHVDIPRIDIEGSERGMVFETHFPVKFRLLKHDHETRLWRIERKKPRFRIVHAGRIRLAHTIRMFLDR